MGKFLLGYHPFPRRFCTRICGLSNRCLNKEMHGGEIVEASTRGKKYFNSCVKVIFSRLKANPVFYADSIPAYIPEKNKENKPFLIQ